MKLTSRERQQLLGKKRKPTFRHYGPSLKDVAFITGINQHTLSYRIRVRGMKMAEAVSEPIMSYSAAGDLGKKIQMQSKRKGM